MARENGRNARGDSECMQGNPTVPITGMWDMRNKKAPTTLIIWESGGSKVHYTDQGNSS